MVTILKGILLFINPSIMAFVLSLSVIYKTPLVR